MKATGRPAVSLPNGCNSLPPEILPCLEKFKKLYIWMDDDLPGQEGAEKFARKLGLSRYLCLFIICEALFLFIQEYINSYALFTMFLLHFYNYL